jgi:hypothetical protein
VDIAKNPSTPEGKSKSTFHGRKRHSARASLGGQEFEQPNVKKLNHAFLAT